MSPACKTVFDGAHARAVYFNPAASRLRVKLRYRRDGAAGFKPPEPQQAAINAGDANLWVQAAQNDYYLSPDLPALRRALFRFAPVLRMCRQ